MLSERLVQAVRGSSERQYRLARQIGVAPGTLSAWICGIYDPPRGDPRVRKLGALLGVPDDDLFVSEASK